MRLRRNVEADLADEPRGDYGPLVVEESESFEISGRIADKDSVIPGQKCLQPAKSAQVCFDFLQGDQIEPLTNIGDVLQRTAGFFV